MFHDIRMDTLFVVDLFVLKFLSEWSQKIDLRL